MPLDRDATRFDMAQGIRAAELGSTRLAAKGRLIAIGTFTVYVLTTSSGPLLYNSLLVLAAFGLLALAMLLSARASLERPWIRYLLVALEVIILTEAVLTPNPFNPDPWPSPMVFRYDNFYFFFALIAVSVFSYSPSLVLWAGLCTALAWSVGVALHVASDASRLFSEAARGITSSRDLLAVYVDPTVIVLSARVKEVITALLVSALLAAVVWRGRRTVQSLLSAERDRRLLSDLFGRYVPQQVVSAIIEDRGILHPEERQATILFVDIANFTSIVERMQPGDALAMLNEYFAAATEVVGRYRGVVTQFQGDAILASFNVPVEDPEHALNAVRAARELLSMVRARSFAGQALRVRIGINTGSVVAGTVGGAGRMFYTVHGDAVNIAARLEQLNKTYGTEMLVADATRDLVGETGTWRVVGHETLRGRQQALGVHTLEW